MKKYFVMILIALNTVFPHSLFSCTIFNASKNGLVLVGNNEDMFSTDTKVWFVPPTNGTYGVVYVGFTKYGKQGAMNDHGLFFDANALKYARMKSTPEKPRFNKSEKFIEKIMRECETTEEVIQKIKAHNLEGWNDFQIMFVDRTGASAVLSPNKEGELAIIRKKGDYQVSTNFNLANPQFGAYSYPCRRFDIANEMLKDLKELTVDYFRSILAAVHSEGGSPTVYSNICDLTNKEIYIYNFHNFEEVARFKLEDELKKGEHSYEISSLFPRKTHAQTTFEKKQENALSSILLKTIEEESIKSAIKQFKQIKEKYSLVPEELDKLALLLRVKGKMNERLEIYKLYAKEFPKLFNGHKKLGDIYLVKGEKKKAIKSYKKALKLDSQNIEVIEILKNIK